MLTQSGRLVLPTNNQSPSVEDIAYSLGRVPRFGGHTRTWWTVLHHSLVVARLLPPELAIYGLLHDAHECVTGDIPTTWKLAGNRAEQAQLDLRIYARLGLRIPNEGIAAIVSDADHRAFLAECVVVGPAGIHEMYPGARPEDLVDVRTVLARFWEPNSTIGERSPGVQHFRSMVYSHLRGDQ